jgi:hypothetical protein
MAEIRYIKAGTTAAQLKTATFFCVDATDGKTPETGEAGGQPEISVSNAAWTTTGIGTLQSDGLGGYFAVLTDATVNTQDRTIRTRYKSSNTLLAIGTTFITTAYDPANATQSVSLVAGAVTTAAIADGALTAAKFAANAITSTVVADGTITAAKIGADAITNAKIADNAIAVENIASGALSEPKFAALSLNAAKFASDLNAYSVVARLVQTGASSQQVTLFISKNGEPQNSSTLDSVSMVITNTSGTVKFTGSPTEFGSAGFVASLSGGSLISSGEAAEAYVTFTVGSTNYARSAPVEKQYT